MVTRRRFIATSAAGVASFALPRRAQSEIEALLRAHGLADVGGDPVADLVEAQLKRMTEEGMETRVRRRYIVWGDKPKS